MQGSMRERRPGVWQIRVCAGRDPATRRFRYVTRTVQGGKRDAQRAAAKLVSSVEGGMLPAARGTVAQLLEQWMAHIEVQGRSPSTLSRYRSAIRANIVPVLGDLQLAQLSAADIDAFYGKLLKSGLNPLSVRKCHAILSASCRQAVRWGWIDRSPVERSSPPSARGREIVPPSIDEVRLLLRSAEETNPELAALIFAAATTGCRRGELCGLRWSDVDLDNRTVVVRRSIADADGNVSVKGTKTHQARRLALDPATIEVLRRHRAMMEARAIAAETTLFGDAYVWSQVLDASAPYRPDRVTGIFRNLTERLGMTHVTFHTLRHFAATALAGTGVPVRTIAGRLGHSNPNLTLRTYAHFLEAADRDAAVALHAVTEQLMAPAEIA
jgi:integrase